MSKGLYKIILNDIDEPDEFSTQETIIEIDHKNIDKLTEIYNLYDEFWRNSGDLYESYEEYCKDWDENEIIKNHFDAFVDSADERDPDALISLFKEVYPNEYIEIKNYGEIEYEY